MLTLRKHQQRPTPSHSPREVLDLVEQLQALRMQATRQLVGLEDHTHSISQLVQAGLVLCSRCPLERSHLRQHPANGGATMLESVC